MCILHTITKPTILEPLLRNNGSAFTDPLSLTGRNGRSPIMTGFKLPYKTLQLLCEAFAKFTTLADGDYTNPIFFCTI